MKNYTFLLITTLLFSCAKEQTKEDKIIQELSKYSSLTKDSLYDGRILYSGTINTKNEADIKGIIDKNLGATPTEKNEDYYSEHAGSCKFYTWDLPDRYVRLESCFKKNSTIKVFFKSK